MRKLISFILATLMLLSVWVSVPMTAFATGPSFTFEIVEDGEEAYAKITAITTDDEGIVIPLTYEESSVVYSVKEIAENALSADNLKYVFYEGTEEDYFALTQKFGSGNDSLIPGESNTVKFHYEATDHTRQEVITKYCDKSGSVVVTCTVCGDELLNESIEPTGHNFNSWSIIAMPSCSTIGTMSHTCQNEWCDSDYEDGDVKTAVTEISDLAVIETAHSFGEWEVETASTCTEKGLEKRVCANNPIHVETREIDELGHDYSNDFTIDENATCTQDGSKSRHCTRENCDAVTDVTVITASHSIVETVIEDSTCNKDGSKTVSCENCDYIEENVIIPKKEHTPSESWTFGEDSTCDKEGYLYKKCTLCGEETERTSIDKRSHEFGEWVEVTPSDCENKGSEKRECSNCDYFELRDIDELGHDYEELFTIDTEPTCEEKGSKSHHCSRCDSKIDVTEIDELGHNYNEEFTVDTEPTCEEKGSKSQHCTRCDSKINVTVIDETGHIDYDLVTEKEATCTEAGIVNKICKCGKFLEKLTIEPKEHTLTDWIIDKDATCTESGSKHIECSVCEGVLKSEIIAVKGHSFGDWVIKTDATCLLDGEKYRICTVCEEKENGMIEKIAHKNAVLKDEKNATCVLDGYSGDLYCPDCEEIIEKGEIIKATGHTPSEWITDKEPTFEETGTQHKECTVCKEELEKSIIDKLSLLTPEVKVENDAKGVKVSWNKIENAIGYTVYSSEYNDSTKKWSKWKNRGTAKDDKFSWTDKKTVNGKTYKYTVRAINGKYKSDYEDSAPIIFVTMPEKAKLSIASNGIKVSWGKIEGATGYTVYSSNYDAETGTWTKWKNRGTAKSNVFSWTDKSAESGVNYKYTVRAVNGKFKSDYVESGSLIFLAQPTLTISNGSQGIVGSWKLVDGAEGYTIYRSEYNAKTKKWSAWLNLGTTKSTAKSFTDKTVKDTKKYKYTIRAVNGKLKSTYKATNELIRLGEVSVKISITAEGLKGAWNKVSGAEGYTVYRSQLVDGKWSSWKNLGTAKSTIKSFTDKTVKCGETYKYAVRAIKEKSRGNYVESNSMIFLSVPVVKIENDVLGMKASWGKIAGAENYIVYRAQYDSKTKTWSSWKNLGTISGELSSFVDENAKSGITYKYTVRALNGTVKSLYEASASLYCLSTPKVTAKISESNAEITWEKIDGAKSYIVYRTEKIENEWTGWQNLGTVTKTQYVDETIEPESTYKYTVRALNGKIKSDYLGSNEVKVSIAE